MVRTMTFSSLYAGITTAILVGRLTPVAAAPGWI